MFKENIKPIATALSKQFASDLQSLATLLDPDNPPSSQNLVPSVQELKAAIANTQTKENASRLLLAQESAKVHALNRQATECSIRLLEQTLHGVVARGSKAKADYLAVVAEGMGKKLSLQHGQLMAQVYSPEVQDVLSAKSDELEGRARKLKRDIREAEERLDGYSKIGGMEGVAREYAEVLAQTERVQAETARLEEGWSNAPCGMMFIARPGVVTHEGVITMRRSCSSRVLPAA